MCWEAGEAGTGEGEEALVLAELPVEEVGGADFGWGSGSGSGSYLSDSVALEYYSMTSKKNGSYTFYICFERFVCLVRFR